MTLLMLYLILKCFFPIFVYSQRFNIYLMKYVSQANKKRNFFIFLFSGILIVGVSACNTKKEETKPLLESISESVYASGIIKSRNQYQVYPKASGTIAAVFVKEGDLVKKGTPILRISNETASLQAENARLGAEYADINKNRDRLNELLTSVSIAKNRNQNDSILFSRQQNLWNSGVGSKVELEQRELAYSASHLNLEAALLRYQDLEKQLNLNSQQSNRTSEISRTLEKDYTVISAVDGKVYALLKEKGEFASTQSVIAIIGDANDFYPELQIDEYDINRIQVGQKVFLNMDSYKGNVYEALVTKIDPIMDERSRSFKLEAQFINRPEMLYPNLTVEANILIHTKDKALTIPRSYLVDDTYVLNKDQEKIKIKTGLLDYNKVEVLEGLTVDDIIVKQVK